MTTRERIRKTLEFQPVDRRPILEWGPWWHLTLERWHADGLDPALLHLRWGQPGMPVSAPEGDIGDFLGLDPFRVAWLTITAPDCPPPPGEGLGYIADMADYEAFKPYLYREPEWMYDYFSDIARTRENADMALWLYCDGFFWGPRKLLGIEPHLYSFYDQPELLHAINRDMTDYYKRIMPRLFEIAAPDVMLFSEDLSYNHGPMLSQASFEEFLTPYYHELLPLVKSFGIHPLMDSDGDIMPIIPWCIDAGIEGLGPLERMAGVDLNVIRREYPRFLLLGGFDKREISKGEAAVRREFERIRPVIASGGYLPMPDHQTPPDASLDDYRRYLELFREYTRQ